MLTITAIQRVNPAPCDHWNITIQNDVIPETVVVRGLTMTELRNNERYDDVRWWVLLALLWLRARLAGGFTAAQSLNVEIVG